MVDKILHMSLLYDFYGQLLTKKQQNTLQLYYDYDLSLGEMSEQLSVSRQAVYDSIKRTEKLLSDYESKMGLIQKFVTTQKKVQMLINIIEEIETKYKPNEKIDIFLDDISKLKSLTLDIVDK
ncbi:putative DNA-binding protein [Lutibacter sp. B2]|nr:putative DNA-binding protein [Lutibacter sp. B2]